MLVSHFTKDGYSKKVHHIILHEGDGTHVYMCVIGSPQMILLALHIDQIYYHHRDRK